MSKAIFKKIKVLNDSVHIEWKVPKKEGYSDHSVDSPDEPKEAFRKALANLKPHLISMCEIDSLDAESKKLIKVTGVSLKYKGETDIMNAVITGTKTHKNSGGCLILNSPNKAAEADGEEETAEQNLLSENCIKAIDKVIVEAEAYLKGERLQTNLLGDA